jgi:hypothetical protein
MLIDSLSRGDLVSALGTSGWMGSDRLMGGVSDAQLRCKGHVGRPCLHLHRHSAQ